VIREVDMGKHRIFIGSSLESKHIANALQANLDDDAEVTVWDQDIFLPGENILESLTGQLVNFDFAVFVFSADDEIKMRGYETSVARDNVIFEMGIVIGMLGRYRAIFVKPKGVNLHIPSDLQGINYASFNPDRSDSNWRAALNPAADTIRIVLKKFDSELTDIRRDLTRNDMKLLRATKERFVPSNTAKVAFGALPVKWDDRLCRRYIRLVYLGLAFPVGTSEVGITPKGQRLLAL
jgi:hypothetical protein